MNKSRLSPADRKFIHRNVRVRYPNLFEPQTTQYVTAPHYSIQVLLGDSQDAPAYMAYENHLRDCLTKEFGEPTGSKVFEQWKLDKTYRIQWSENLGQFYVTLRRKAAQGIAPVYNSSNQQVDGTEGIPKSGDWCDVMEDSWVFDKGARSRGVSGTLMGVRFRREGEPLGGAPIATASSWDAPAATQSEQNVPGFDDDYI